MSKRNTPSGQATDPRKATLRLAEVFQQLRQNLAQKRQKTNDSWGVIAAQTASKALRVKAFAEGEQALCAGRFMRSLVGKYLNRPELATEIEALSNQLESRALSVALLPSTGINLYFDLLELAEKSNLGLEKFSQIFGPQAEAVRQSLNRDFDGLKLLDRNRAHIQALLKDAEFRQVLERTVAQEHQTVREQAQRFNELFKQLGFVSQAAACGPLECKPGLISDVMRGNPDRFPSNELYSELVAKAESLLAARGKEKEKVEPPAIPALGTTTSEGVRFVLTPQIFKLLEGDPGEDAVAFAIRQMEMTRASLNLLAQVKDYRLRAKIRKSLGREVEETYLAIRLFTETYPNALVEVYQGMREFQQLWHKQSPENKIPNGHSDKKEKP